MKICGISEDYGAVGVCGVKKSENKAKGPFRVMNAVLTATGVSISCVPIMYHSQHMLSLVVVRAQQVERVFVSPF